MDRTILTLAALSLLTIPFTAQAGLVPDLGPNVIQPGDSLGGFCTLNFVYDGVGPLAGNVYIGTAAHCVSLGDHAVTDGFGVFGTVVYDGEGGTDFALIEVRPEHHDDVFAGVAGHPDVPVGYTTHLETLPGSPTLLSGKGLVLGSNPVTGQNRLGVLVTDTDEMFFSETPAIFGDSGGPVIDVASGKALGLVTGAVVGVPTYSLLGPTIEGAMTIAGENGFPVTLRTV